MRLLLALVVLLAALKCGDATGRPAGPYNINNILSCNNESPRNPFRVSISADQSSGQVFPVETGFQSTFPGGRLTFGLMRRLFGMLSSDFAPGLQAVRRPPNLGDPIIGQTLCDEDTNAENDDLLEQVDWYVTSRMQRHTDENLLIDSGINQAEPRRAFNTTLTNYFCRIIVRWRDEGVQYFPRYYQSGSCNPRRCSLPDRGNFICRPDLDNPAQMTEIHVFRWDCCWTVRNNQQVFDCGWRRVIIPIVCDCDCECGLTREPPQPII